MYCVIQQVMRKKPNPYGEYKELRAYQNQWRLDESKPFTWAWERTGGRFERPHMEAYKITLRQSYREGSAVRKRQHSICTMSYYDIVEWSLLSAPLKNVIFRRNEMSFFVGQHTSVYSLNYRPTCRLEARQVLIYQCILDLTGENDKYNYSMAVHFYSPFSYILCSAKNYKIASALTVFPYPFEDVDFLLATSSLVIAAAFADSLNAAHSYRMNESAPPPFCPK